MHKSQLELYLDERMTGRNTPHDTLSFWKGNKFCYPSVICMAHDILNVFVYILAYESIFSVCKRIID